VSGFFLGVETSALGRPWRPRLDGPGEARALAIAQVGGRDDLLARVLAGRGVAPEAVDRYLDPTLRDLMPDPYTMRDMEAATRRLVRAAEAREKVAIFGDYDVDGACSAALLGEYLRACGCETLVHIPDRVTEGYGANVAAMESFAAAGASAQTRLAHETRRPRARAACCAFPETAPGKARAHPGFAPAWAGIADAYERLADWGVIQRQDAALRARAGVADVLTHVRLPR